MLFSQSRPYGGGFVTVPHGAFGVVCRPTTPGLGVPYESVRLVR